MKTFYIRIFLALIIIVASCSNPKESNQEKGKDTEVNGEKVKREFTLDPVNISYQVEMTGYNTVLFSQHYKSRVTPPVLNLNQPLENKTISDLGLLSNTLLAMKGKIFTDAIYAAYFDTIPWYQPPYWEEEFKIELNEAEEQFLERITYYIGLLQRNNYNDEGIPNPDNIINTFQWHHLSDNIKLKEHGFSMGFTELNQPVEIYEQNKIENIPSIITTDLIMHQMHLLYGVLENEIEEVYLTQKLKSMLEIINIELYSSYEKTLDPDIERAIEENLLYYSIPYAVITGKKTNLIGSYNQLYVDELTKVLDGNGIGSKILNDDQFDYAIFKPYRQYAKTDKITKYYKALTWLQKIDLCLNHENDFKKALIVAYIINKNKPLQNEYREFIELKTYFSSQRDQFTLWDLADEIKKIDNIKLFEDLFKEDNLSQIRKTLQVKIQEECALSVSLMPIEYQNRFTDLEEITKIESPSSIDLFAALNNPAATDIFNSVSTKSSNQGYLTSITENLVYISSQEDARSMDWLSTLLTSFNTNTQGQAYMSKSPWKRKELNSAMSSWVLLNQRVSLNAVGIQNDVFKKSDKKVLKGYVVPNRSFWRATQILLSNTKTFFTDRGMLSKKSNTNIEGLMDIVNFLDDVSEKQLARTPLKEEEFVRINEIGNECHTLSLKMINPNFNTNNQKIQTNMAYATNIYLGGNNKNVIGGIGNPGYILAIVEIEGVLYLTKGALYNYYEIPNNKQRTIDQSEWKKLLNNDLPPVKWAQELYVD